MNYGSEKKIYENSLLKHIIVISLFSVLIFSILMFSDYGFYSLIKLQSKKNDLILENKNIRSKLDSLKNEIIHLKKDTLEIERIAREKYGMVKNGEKVFMIDLNSDSSNKLNSNK